MVDVDLRKLNLALCDCFDLAQANWTASPKIQGWLSSLTSILIVACYQIETSKGNVLIDKRANIRRVLWGAYCCLMIPEATTYSKVSCRSEMETPRGREMLVHDRAS